MMLNARLFLVCGAFGAQWNGENGITWRNSLDEVIMRFSVISFRFSVFGYQSLVFGFQFSVYRFFDSSVK